MIDFHNHIIPNLDDGSKSVQMSLDMLNEAQSQGITDIINTIHFQHPKMEDKDTSYNFVINEIKKMQEIAKNNNININIHAASEVFFKYNLTEILDNPITTFGNGKYMLIEFQRLSFPKNYEEEIFKLQLKNITPIIAHPERYRTIQNNLSLVDKWIDRGYKIQIDCASIMGGFGKETQTTAINLLEKGFCHLLGSDAHNNKTRNFLMKPTLENISNTFNNDISLILKSNAEKVLNGLQLDSYTYNKTKKSFFEKVKSFLR